MRLLWPLAIVLLLGGCGSKSRTGVVSNERPLKFAPPQVSVSVHRVGAKPAPAKLLAPWVASPVVAASAPQPSQPSQVQLAEVDETRKRRRYRRQMHRHNREQTPAPSPVADIDPILQPDPEVPPAATERRRDADPDDAPRPRRRRRHRQTDRPKDLPPVLDDVRASDVEKYPEFHKGRRDRGGDGDDE